MLKEKGLLTLINPTGDVSFSISGFNPASFKMTVSGLGSESPSNVTFTEDINDVNYIGTFPTFEEVTIGDDIFIKIPTMYRKVNTIDSDQITSFTICDYPLDSSYHPYPCFLDEDGVTVLPYILIGKYMCSSDTVANSVNATYVTQTITTGRTNARAKGAGYQLYDWQIHKLFQDLVICFKKTIDTNPGTGFLTMLGIKHQDNSFWIDGVNSAQDNKYVFCYKPSAYTDQATSATAGYFQSSYTHPTSSSDICVSKLGYDTSHPFMNYPSGAVYNRSFNTYYCDYFYYSTADTCPIYGNNGYAQAYRGVFHCYNYNSWTASLGVRLCYRPVTIYNITNKLTNCTKVSGPTNISKNNSVTLVYTADAGCYLPDAVTVTGASVTSWTKSTGTLVISNPTDNVSITINGMMIPTKGQLITMNLGNGTPAVGTNNLYRVLSVNGTVVEVVAMYDINTNQQFHSSSNTYGGSTLDTCLNSTFYNTLNATAKAAIVDKTFTQDSWDTISHGNPLYQGVHTSGIYEVSLGNAEHDWPITRHIYALSVQDIIDYLEVTPGMTTENTTLRYTNIWTMFYGTSSKPSIDTYPLLRSAYTRLSNGIWYVYSTYGLISSYDVADYYSARPAFQIDLSKIEWSEAPSFQMTVAGLGSQSPSSVTFTNDVGAFPTFEEVTIGSDKFIKIPTMYRKVNTVVDNQITSFTIASKQVASSYKPYPCFLKEDGITVMPYILIGKYACSSNTVANSVDATAISVRIDAGRALCRNKGAGYQQMDWMIHKLWQDLVICGMKTINTNSGSGINIDVVGVSWKNAGSDIYPWIDGINRIPGNYYLFSYKPSAYINQAQTLTADYIQSSYAHPSSTSQSYVSKLGYDDTHPFLNCPSETDSSGSSNTYYCDCFYLSSGSASNPMWCDIGSEWEEAGVFSYNLGDAWGNPNNVRLCYRPINE